MGFKGKFCRRSIELLFHLEAIYLPVLKSLVHLYEMWQINRLWLTQIYLYRWYILDLETNPGPAVADNIDNSKTICAPYFQIYLAVLAIANSFRKLCPTAKENHVA